MAIIDKIKMMAGLVILAVGLLAGGMESAQAYCSASGNKWVVSLNFGQVSVPYNAAVGSSIAYQVPTGGPVTVANCDNSGGYWYPKMIYNGGVSSGRTYTGGSYGTHYVYNTNIPGVGIWIDAEDNPPVPILRPGPSAWYFNSREVHLIKTGTIDVSRGNTLLTGDAINDYFDDGIDVADINITGGTINVQPAPCHINNDNDIQVHFGNIDRSILTSSPDSAPSEAVRTVQIPITCDDGSKPSFTMTWNYTSSTEFEYTTATILSSNSKVGVVPFGQYGHIATNMPMSYASGVYNGNVKLTLVRTRTGAAGDNSDISTGTFHASATIKVTFD